MEDKLRWRVEASYRTIDGVKTNSFEVEELLEIHQIIETGPNWGGLISITIFLNADEGMTVEEADGLLIDLTKTELEAFAKEAREQNPMTRKLN